MSALEFLCDLAAKLAAARQEEHGALPGAPDPQDADALALCERESKLKCELYLDHPDNKSSLVLKTTSFSSWQQRPYLFRFKPANAELGEADFMHQNASIYPVYDDAGVVQGACIAIQDVSDLAEAKALLDNTMEHALSLEESSQRDALTGGAVDFTGAYKGGIICPGLNLSLDALVGNTAKLPRIAIEAPRTDSVIGTNTEDQMLIGVFWGYVAMMEGLIARMRAEIGRPARVVATGGLAILFDAHTDIFDAVDADLTLDGLAILAERAAAKATAT